MTEEKKKASPPSLRKVVKHLISDDTLPIAEGVHVYSCEFDDGKKVRHTAYQAGNGTVVLFPCRACQAELNNRVLEPIIGSAVKEAILSNMKILKTQDDEA